MLIDTIMKEHPDRKRPDAVFKIQNVADYVFADPKNAGAYDLYWEECFSYRLPFPVVWFEFRGDIGRVQFGFITALEDHKFCASFFMGSGSRVDHMGTIYLPLNDEYRLIRQTNYEGYPSDTYTREYLPFFRDNGISPDRADDFTLGIFSVITTALNFLHCKNVNITENHIPKKLIKANFKRGKEKPYFEKYYTLAIEPMKQILNTEGQAQSVGIRKAFHICRGHFKTYDEKPLFGKLRGTFWTPAHAKGNIERGSIKKDYEIKI